VALTFERQALSAPMYSSTVRACRSARGLATWRCWTRAGYVRFHVR